MYYFSRDEATIGGKIRNQGQEDTRLEQVSL